MRKTIYCRNNFKNTAYFTIASLSFALIVFPLASPNVKITVLNVGQGDCTFIELPGGKTMLVDGGGSAISDSDTAKYIIRPYLVRNSITKIDYAVISHLHNDHADGILNLAESFRIGCIIIPDSFTESGNAERLFKICRKRSIPLYTADAGDSFSPCDNTDFTVYSPDKNIYHNENDSSMVFKLSAFGKSILFTGDIEEETRLSLSEKGADIKADILKMPHHGQYSDADSKFISAVNPKEAYICVGENNSYGHPNNETLILLAKKGVRVQRTDLDREIKYTIYKN